MKKLDTVEMAQIEGGGFWKCFLGILGGAAAGVATVLSGGALGIVLAGAGGGLLGGVAGGCFDD